MTARIVITTTTQTSTSGSNTININQVLGQPIIPGMSVSGTNIGAGSKVQSIVGNTVTLTVVTTGAISSGASITFTDAGPTIGPGVGNVPSSSVNNDFNTIQKYVAAVLGVGGTDPRTSVVDKTFGYNQSVNSSQVSANAKISALQWHNLRTDLLRCRWHQTGADLGSTVRDPYDTVNTTTLGYTITEADRVAYLAMANDCIANRLATPPTNMATRSYFGFGSLVNTGGWNDIIQHTVTIPFQDDNTARGFFNAGGRIEFSATIAAPGGGFSSTSNRKDVAWNTIFTGMGTVYFGYNSTTCTGTGSTSNIGFLQLTSSAQTIFSKSTSADAAYTANDYRITASYIAPNLYLTVLFEDLSIGSNAPYNVDEVVDGIVTSKVQAYYATGAYVQHALPPATSTTASFTITIGAITGLTPTTVNATRYVASSQVFTPSGGNAPYDFSLASGTLPPGLSLSALGNVSTITLSGTPTGYGTFNFSFKLVDNAGQSTVVAISYIIDANVTTQSVAYTAGGTVQWKCPISFVGTATILLVAGGGSGGRAGASGSGGGGAGGVVYQTGVAVNPGSTYTVTVGLGGNPGNGGNSVFNNLTAIGGGRGAGIDTSATGSNGGSGGGGAGGTGGTPTSGQGNSGGTGSGGGGGGVNGSGNGATGGPGKGYTINGATYTVGGGGGAYSSGTGGTGGGGAGSSSGTVVGTAGSANTGGGGGGSGATVSAAPGGSGIVVISGTWNPAQI
jgi:hypothetical protein